jgi:voltage-gated potassium channel
MSLFMVPERNPDALRKKFFILIVSFVAIIGIGAFGYSILESKSLGEALPMSITSAVGYGFAGFQNGGTIVLAAFIMVLEWACIWIAFDIIVESVSEGKVRAILEGDHIKKTIGRMKDHYIVAGFGRVGTEIAQNLNDSKAKFVVIEKDPHAFRHATQLKYTVIHGDLSHEETLSAAGIEKADTLIVAVGRDADNVLITLTAKGMNPDINIIARAEKPQTINKLKQAGASEVVLPSVIGGRAMADVALGSGSERDK